MNTDFTTPGRRAVLFARVSSREQEQGQSTEAQLENLHRYCQREGISILKEYKITESSTKGERKKFYEMLKFVRNQKGKILIVADCVDRIQRSFKESIALDELRNEDKIELHFVREHLILSKESETTDITRWDFSVMAAKTYVGNLRDNVKRSMKYNWEHGRWQGFAPLGYMNVRDENNQTDVVLDPVRAPLVKELFERYAAGTYSLEKLEEFAKDNGLYARYKKGRIVDKDSIFLVLKNPFYYGVMIIKGKMYEHKHPRLITKELFDTVQDVMHGRKRAPNKVIYGTKPFATRGIVRCSCGCALTPEFHKKKSGKIYTYVRCSHYHPHCKQLPVSEKIILEQFRTQVIENIRIPEAMIPELKKEIKNLIAKDDTLALNSQKLLKGQITALEDSENKLLDFYLNGKIDEEVYNKRHESNIKEIADLKARLAKYAVNEDNLAEMLENLIDILGQAGKIFDSSKPEVQNEFLRILVSNSVLDGEKVRISLHKPFEKLLGNPNYLFWLRGRDLNHVTFRL